MGGGIWGVRAFLPRANLDERLSDDYVPKHQATISPRWGLAPAVAGGLGLAASTLVMFASPPGGTSYEHHAIIGTPSGLILLGLGVVILFAAWTTAKTGAGRWATLPFGLLALLLLGRAIFLYARFDGDGERYFLGPGAYVGLAAGA